MSDTPIATQRRSGPLPWLKGKSALNVQIESRHRAILDAYCVDHGIPVAAAVRTAIEGLSKPAKSAGKK